LNQWILDYIGGKPFVRNRQLEFDADKTHSKEELILMMTNLSEELRSCIQSVTYANCWGLYSYRINRKQAFQF
jgi:hypothetical protein